MLSVQLSEDLAVRIDRGSILEAAAALLTAALRHDPEGDRRALALACLRRLAADPDLVAPALESIREARSDPAKAVRQRALEFLAEECPECEGHGEIENPAELRWVQAQIAAFRAGLDGARAEAEADRVAPYVPGPSYVTCPTCWGSGWQIPAAV